MNAFKNAFKILGNKFAFLWIHIGYYALAFFLLASVCLSVLVPYINKIVDGFNMAKRISEIGQVIIDGGALTKAADLIKTLAADIGSVFTGSTGFPTISILLLLTILWRFVLGLGDVAFYHCIDMHLSSAIKQNFRASFIKNMGKSAKYQLCKMLFALPLDIALFGILYLASILFSAPLLLFFTPFVLLLLFILLYSLRLSVFSGWAPEILHSENKKIFPAFYQSFKLLGKNFGRVYGSVTLYVTIAVAVNIFFGIFTLGVGLIVTVPLTFYMMFILNSTLYYQNNNLRYYVDKDTIIN